MTPRRPTTSLCVTLCVSLCCACTRLRHSAWDLYAAFSSLLLPLSSTFVTIDSLSFFCPATLPLKSNSIPSKSTSFGLLSVCSTCFPNDPQDFFYNLLIDKSTVCLRLSLMSIWNWPRCQCSCDAWFQMMIP